MVKQISDKKQKQYDDFLISPLEVGEKVVVSGEMFPLNFSNKPIKAVIESINGDDIVVSRDEKSNDRVTITKDKVISRPGLFYVGANPMVSRDHSVRFVAFSLHSILHSLGIIEDRDKYHTKSGHLIKRNNFNPFVYDKDGKKVYYQRPFVWTENENQLLIESIYQRIECGRILIRKRSWEECEKMGEEAAFIDVVDGKQRLNAIQKFINNEYPDLHGNYFSDLSNQCQGEFLNHQLFSYAEMDEDTPDNKVIEQFLKLNFAGVPQSKEHIEFVKSINV